MLNFSTDQPHAFKDGKPAIALAAPCISGPVELEDTAARHLSDGVTWNCLRGLLCIVPLSKSANGLGSCEHFVDAKVRCLGRSTFASIVLIACVRATRMELGSNMEAMYILNYCNTDITQVQNTTRMHNLTQ